MRLDWRRATGMAMAIVGILLTGGIARGLMAVEKALYWDSEGAVWAGGTNVTATRLPPR